MANNKKEIESFQDRLTEYYNELGQEERRNAQRLFELCLKKKTAKPNQKWITQTSTLLASVDEKLLARQHIAFLLQMTELIREVHRLRKVNGEIHFLNERFQELIKGFIWLSGLINDDQLTATVEELGLWCFKKIPGVGALSAKLGNACLYAMASLPFQIGIEKLTRFRMKIKYASVQKQVARYIETIAEKEGKTPDEIEEMVISDFGLDLQHQTVLDMGLYQAVLKIKKIGQIEIGFFKGDIPVKTLPPAIKSANKEVLAALSKKGKDIKTYLPVQRDRIEQFYLKQRRWRYKDWVTNYIEHPLVNFVAKGLVWHFAKGKKKTITAIWYNGQWQDVNGKEVAWIGAGVEVTLWHPIGFSADFIVAWRERLAELKIQQPFKQAYREIYILTDAELETHDYSNRFAAHILRQHQFAALCKIRGWKFRLLGQWDGHTIPTLELPHWDMMAEYWVEVDWDNGETTSGGVFNHVFTDQVRFYEAGEQLEMADVPAIVFSEVMRDVDLYVGVTSIGNDPSWQDGGNDDYDDYWRNYSFAELSESSKVRKEVLQNLVPRLKIASRCTFDGRYLLVKGDLRTYKIHIGSGNILMEPNDQYLCIVPNRKDDKTTKVFLPFEGDHMLSIIISKAMLLAEDRKIKDRTILSQIG